MFVNFHITHASFSTLKLLKREWGVGNGKLKWKIYFFLHSALSTLCTFHTMHFPHSTFSTLRTPCIPLLGNRILMLEKNIFYHISSGSGEWSTDLSADTKSNDKKISITRSCSSPSDSGLIISFKHTLEWNRLKDV